MEQEVKKWGVEERFRVRSFIRNTGPLDADLPNGTPLLEVVPGATRVGQEVAQTSLGDDAGELHLSGLFFDNQVMPSFARPVT